MSIVASLMTGQAAQALAWALIHFLWQGVVLAGAAFVLLRWTRPSSAVRYAVGVATLAAMLAAPMATFAVLVGRAETPSATFVTFRDLQSAVADRSSRAAADDGIVRTTSEAGSLAAMGRIRGLPMFVILVWLCGVAALSTRTLGGWLVARRLAVRAVRPVTPAIDRLAGRIANRLALTRLVRIVESCAVSVPMMMGWLKPVVVMPAAALAGLTPMQIEALLAHELAHVRRHDYLVNIFQVIVETLLFYHPLVWWVSREVRADREHCCDDLAVGICDRLVYVSALTELAAMTTATPRLALAATDGPLLRRVRRILDDAREDSAGSGWTPALVTIVLLGLGVGSVVLASTRPPIQNASVASGILAERGSFVRPATGEVVTATAILDGGTPPDVETAAVGSVSSESIGRSASGSNVNSPLGALSLIRDASQDGRQVEAELEKQLELARSRLIESEKQVERLHQERLTLELKKSEGEMKARRDALAEELDAIAQRLARAKAMFEKGLASPDVVAEAQSVYDHISRELKTAEAQMTYKAAVAAIDLQEAEHARAYQRAQDEYVKLLAEKESATERTRALGSQAPTSLLEQSAPVSDPGARVRTGDVLVVEIAGEPDFPRAFAVAADVAIRLPLMGSLRVDGLTASEVADALARRLAANGFRPQTGVGPPFISSQLEEARARLDATRQREATAESNRDLRTLVGMVSALEAKLTKEMQASGAVRVTLRRPLTPGP